MTENLTFTYGKDAILDAVDGETSRRAAFLRFQDGGSAYDVLKVHTNDVPTIEGFVQDAFHAIGTAFGEDCVYSFTDTDHALGFYLPDFDTERTAQAENELKRYVVVSATARWLLERSFADYAKVVSDDAVASLNRAVSVLRTRLSPLED